MLENIDINKMNQLIRENRDARKIIPQLLENHHTEISMIAHEIRNPLTLVSSSLQIIETQHPEVKEFASWEQTMEDVRFMCRLLEDLSTFHNSGFLHYSVFRIERLLKNIAVSFAISLDADDTADICFSSRIAPDLGDFTGDKIKLEQLLLNLLRNAREAAGSSGRISLEAHRKEDEIIIRCLDNGCGIPDEIRGRLFEPFVTTKEKGTGLGLTLSRRIAEAHGGSISAESSPEKGTVFTVRLPI